MDSSLTAVSFIIRRVPQSVRAFPFPYRWLLRFLSAFCCKRGLLWLGERRVGIVLAQLLTSQIQKFTVAWERTKIFSSGVSAARIWGKIFKNRQRSRKMRICRMYTAYVYIYVSSFKKAKNNSFSRSVSFMTWLPRIFTRSCKPSILPFLTELWKDQIEPWGLVTTSSLTAFPLQRSSCRGCPCYSRMCLPQCPIWVELQLKFRITSGEKSPYLSWFHGSCPVFLLLAVFCFQKLLYKTIVLYNNVLKCSLVFVALIHNEL